VLDYDHRVSSIDEAVELLLQLFDVGRVQADLGQYPQALAVYNLRIISA
jgi:hypothetical protein